MVIFSVSSTYYLTATCWIGLLSAPSDLPARAYTHWSVPAPRSFHWPCVEQGPLLVLSVRLPPGVVLLSHGQGRSWPCSPLSSGLQWAEIALSRRCPSLASPIHSTFPWLSVSLIILVKIILYLSWRCRFHPEGTHFLFSFGNIWVLEAEGVRLCFSDLKNTFVFSSSSSLLPFLLFPPPSSLSLLPFT